jgi:DNA transformation protein
MANDRGQLAHLRELLEPLGALTTRPMFGCLGLYNDGLFFGLVADDVLYLKADAQTQDAFTAAGCAPFVYDGADGRVATSYWNVPAAALDSSDDLLPWARLALAAAARKPARGKRRG